MKDTLMDYRGRSWFIGNVAHECNGCGKITNEKLEICCDPAATKNPYQLSGFGKIISHTTSDDVIFNLPIITIKTDEGIVEKEAVWVGIEEPKIGERAEFRLRMTKFDRRPHYNTPTRPYSEPLFNGDVFVRKDFKGDEPVIEGWGTYLGFLVLPTKELGRSDVQEKRIAHFSEDSLTMSGEAAMYAVKRAGSEMKGPGTIRFGTEFTFTDSQPYGALIGKKVNSPSTFDVGDIRAACISVLDGLIDCYRAVKSGDSEWGIAAGGDIASFLGRNDPDLRVFTGDGATAYKIGKGNKKNSAATFVKTKDGRVTLRFSDFIPDYDVDKAGNAFHGRRFTGEPAYFNLSNEISKQLKEQFDLNPSDFKYAVFHDPNKKFPMVVGRGFGFDNDQLIAHEVVTPYEGNLYGAMGPLNWALENAEPEDRIFVDKYGSGASRGAIVLERGYADNTYAAPTVEELLNHKKTITKSQYNEIMKTREEILGIV